MYPKKAQYILPSLIRYAFMYKTSQGKFILQEGKHLETPILERKLVKHLWADGF
jgi:hypothetical protein